MTWTHPFFQAGTKRIYLLFALMLGCIGVADSMMGYVAPVFIEEMVGSATVMGIVLSTSSMIGICMDFFFAKFFPSKKSSFFLFLLFSMVFFFPLSFLLSRSPWGALIGMAVWGVYFEALVFSNFHAIHETVRPEDHSWAWGMTSVVRGISWSIGPLLASTLLGSGERVPLYFSLVIYALAVGVGSLFILAQKTSTEHRKVVFHETASRSFGEEIGLWKTYARTLWPLLILNMLFYVIESAFFSVGPLLGEHLKSIHPLGGLFVSIYSVPGIFLGFFVGGLAKPFGKKRLSYLAGGIAGVGLMSIMFASNPFAILWWVFFASVGLGLLHPALSAVFEDFVARSKEFGTDLVGLAAMSGSFAYIIGPLINGFLTDVVGEKAVFGIWGAVIFFYSILLWKLVHRKVRLPQAEAELVIAAAEIGK